MQQHTTSSVKTIFSYFSCWSSMTEDLPLINNEDSNKKILIVTELQYNYNG